MYLCPWVHVSVSMGPCIHPSDLVTGLTALPSLSITIRTTHTASCRPIRDETRSVAANHRPGLVSGGDGALAGDCDAVKEGSSKSQSRFERCVRHSYGDFYTLLIKFVLEALSQHKPRWPHHCLEVTHSKVKAELINLEESLSMAVLFQIKFG